MQYTSTQHQVIRLTRSIVTRIVLAALVGLGLLLSDIHPFAGRTAFILGGPQPAYAQELRERVERDGPIERIGQNGRVIIGDHIYQLSDVVRFYKDFTKDREISPTRFTLGTNVGFAINEFGEIDEMWLE